MSNRKRLGDDVIMAHVDGALPERLNAQIDDLIEQDAASRKRALALKEVARLAHAAYQDVLEEPTPLDLKRRLMAAGEKEAAPERTHAESFDEQPSPTVGDESAEAPAAPESFWTAASPSYEPAAPYPRTQERPDKRRLSERRRARKWRAEKLPQVAAALLLILVSGAAGFWYGGREAAGVAGPGPEASAPIFDERILPGMAVFTALEQKVSGEPVIEGRMSAMARFTFRDGGGRICRQYHIAGDLRAVVGIACRRPDSRWQPQMTVEAVVQNGQVRTVAGGAAALEAYLVTAMASEALSADQERELLARGW